MVNVMIEEEQQKKAINNRVYLKVDYANKDDAKLLGAWWAEIKMVCF